MLSSQPVADPKYVRSYRITRHGAIKENSFPIMCRGKACPPQAKFFLEVDSWQNGDMLYQTHISPIVICINIIVISIHVCCLNAQYVLPAAVMAPTINHTTHGWLSTLLLPHTQHSLRTNGLLVGYFIITSKIAAKLLLSYYQNLKKISLKKSFTAKN